MLSQPLKYCNTMKKIILSLFLLASFTACSIFKTSTDEEEHNSAKDDEVYIFDDVTEVKESKEQEVKDLKEEVDETIGEVKEEPVVDNNISESNVKVEESITQETHQNVKEFEGTVYYLQLGAFSTLERAEQFKKESDSKVPFQLSIIFNVDKALYTVRSSPFGEKTEVNNIREEFWKQNMFPDAFIVSE